MPGEPHRGFDYEAFDARLESLWFQRKTLLASGRTEDARRQGELLLAFAREEGITRLERVAGALVAEASRAIQEGSYDTALESLALAEAFDPGRPQTHLARAAVLWTSGRGMVDAAREVLAAIHHGVRRAWTSMTLLQDAALMAVLGVLATVAVFSVAMLLRYQVPIRHEVEEWMGRAGRPRLAVPAGWAVLLLPLLVWVAAGWILLYWILLSFRFMRRSERMAAVALLVLAVLSVPAHRVAVALYGVLADPAVRTTLAAATGTYDPERVLELRALVEAHPAEPEYRFLLANLYKSGHYVEQAYDEYVHVLALDPSLYQAHVNIGNIFFQAGRHAEAVAEYRKALEIEPASVLALYDMYLAQSESFHFREAEETIARARAVDREGIAELLTNAGRRDEHAVVVDATIGVGSVWAAAIEGRPVTSGRASEPQPDPWRPVARQLVNPWSMVTLAGLFVCPLLGAGRAAARRCIRCGRPFCAFCKSNREGHEYCSQCVHLFVLGDGLAPETKTRKLYEVDRFARRGRRVRRAASLLLPGAGHLLRGRTVRGLVFSGVWLAALVAWKPALLAPLERLSGADLRLDLLRFGSVPAAYGLDPSGFVALALAIGVWIAANVGGLRGREA